MRHACYPSDLTNWQWNGIKDELPWPRRGGRPRTTNLRSVVNAILYLHHTGCPWRYLPRDFPPWKTVYDYFFKWSHAGLWQRLEHALHKLLRVSLHRRGLPRLGIIDSQSVKATLGEAIGNDGFKKIKGRRRHILVDALGFILSCKVYEGNLSDADGGVRLLRLLPQEIEAGLETIIADASYAGRFWSEGRLHHINVQITKRRGEPQSNMTPKRWIVERTISWLNTCRRLVRDYERRQIHSESMVYLAMIPLILRRLAS